VPSNDLARKLIVEFIGPFALTFLGAGAIILTQGNDLVAIALAHGLALGLMIQATGHISGGHFNPAVTIGMWITKRIDPQTAIAYIIAQLAGALAAAGALTLTFRDLERNAAGVNLGVPSVGANLSAGNAFVMEMIMTFFLIYVIFGTAVDRRSSKSIYGLAIGLVVSADIFAGGGVSGAAMNPSRWFGVAVVQGDYSNAWVWIAGPIIGATVAALLYSYVLLPNAADPIDEVEREEDLDVRTPKPVVQRSRRSTRRGR
jgi:aquaporin TIP